MNSKRTPLYVLALGVGVVLSSHAQAASLRAMPAAHDAYTVATGLKPQEPSPEPVEAFNYAWNNFVGALAAAARAVFGSSAQPSLPRVAASTDRLFDYVPSATARSARP